LHGIVAIPIHYFQCRITSWLLPVRSGITSNYGRSSASQREKNWLVGTDGA
jgi:hypothetical protein